MSADPKQIAKVNYDCPTCRGDGQYIVCEDWLYNEWAVCLDCDSWEARARIARLPDLEAAFLEAVSLLETYGMERIYVREFLEKLK